MNSYCIFLKSFITIGLLVLLLQIRSSICMRTRQTKAVKHTPSPNNVDVLQCVVQGADNAFAAVRAGVNTDVCDPVTVVDFKTNGIEASYNYILKTDFIETFSPGVYEQTSEIPGTVNVGSFFEFKIQANGARQFVINLFNMGTDNRILHFRSRAPNIKFNTRVSGSYGPEETVWEHAFPYNRLYILRFTMTEEYIQADVDGSHYYTYKHRTDFTQLTHVHFVSMSDTLTLMEQQRFYIPQ